MTKCGYIGILGRPNAGKSSLLNSIIGEKIAGVSRKPQTTRTRLLGMHHQNETQMIFLDSPGLHRSKAKLNKTFNDVAFEVAADADVLVYLIDAGIGPNQMDWQMLTKLSQQKKPLAVGVSKTDKTKKQKIKFVKDTLLEQLPDLKVFGISAKIKTSYQDLLDWAEAQLPAGEYMYDQDALTNLPTRFIVAELIQEQLFRQLGEEIPYGCAVKIDEFLSEENQTIISASLVVNQKQHKSMVIGQGGRRIKEIGIKSRESIKRLLGQECHLNLHVKVAGGWIDDGRLIAELTQLPQ